tara:strand:+ start:89 stop:556 length:468 start_codon:yes stop_codon:yes gene_type:complete
MAGQLSISDPRFNIREIVKQMLLLEQHLLEPDKHCPDCISKHILTIEALGEEAQNLDKHQDWTATTELLVGKSRVWGAAYQAKVPLAAIGQDVRAVRKKIAPHLLAPITKQELDSLNHYGALQETRMGPDYQTIAMVAIMLAGFGWWMDQRYGRA